MDEPKAPGLTRLFRRRNLRMHERITTRALKLRRRNPTNHKPLSKEARAAERATPEWQRRNTARRTHA